MLLKSILPTLNFKWTSLMGPRLSPSVETTFLLVGNSLTCCCMWLKNLKEIALIDTLVSNNALTCMSYTWILYMAWKPSMNTSLIIDVVSSASHAEELSKSSNMMFLNSEIKLLNSLPESLTGVHSSFTCLLSWNFLQ